jgi:hypothetical protein
LYPRSALVAAADLRAASAPEERMVDLIDGIPTWLLFVLVVGLSGVLSALGLLIVHRLVPADVRRSQNEVAGYISNVAAFVYAVLLASLAVAVWQQYVEAQSTVQLEANAASDVFHQAAGYPEPLRRAVRQGIRAYLDVVIRDEWPRQARGGQSDAAWQTIVSLHHTMLAFEPSGMRQQLLHIQQLDAVKTLLDQRRLRIFAAGAGLQPVIWAVILVGSALIVAFAYLMGTAHFRAHVVMTAMLGASIGLVIFIIAAMNYPFRGGIGISPTAFEEIRENIRLLD